MLPWQQAKYSSSAPDKGTQDKCDTRHLSNSNSLVLLLCQNMLSLWGLLTHICGCAGKKVKYCTLSLRHLFSYTHKKRKKKTCRKKATLLGLASIFMAPHPPSPFKENTAEVSECQRTRICFTFPKCHGIWAACTNERERGVEAGRERTWVKHGW